MRVEYREMKHGERVSLLGFGCMRFPMKQDGSIDEEEAEKMIALAMKQGVNYIDTAFPYHNGESEPFLGRVLKQYERSSFYLATKLPMFKIKTLQEAKEMFENQLQRLDTEYFDFYLLHAMSKERFDIVKEQHIIDYLEEQQKAGRIKNLGFSFHDEYEVFESMIHYRDWDFCQIQYNYIDRNIQAGDRGYALCKEKGVPMVVMEPIKGGNLAFLPKDIALDFKQVDPNASVSSWALRWVGSHDNVKVILSGMSTMEQVEDNLHTFASFKPLTEKEEMIVETVAEKILSRTRNGCTACQYCMPCPFGVNIPGNFKLWNEYARYGNPVSIKQKKASMKEEEMAQNCKECGRCETLCPQHIAIREDLKKVHEELGNL